MRLALLTIGGALPPHVLTPASRETRSIVRSDG